MTRSGGTPNSHGGGPGWQAARTPGPLPFLGAPHAPRAEPVPPILAFDNLHRAFLGASYGKRDRPAVREFEYHLETRLWEIRRELERGAYEWGVLRRFWVTIRGAGCFLSSARRRC